MSDKEKAKERESKINQQSEQPAQKDIVDNIQEPNKGDVKESFIRSSKKILIFTQKFITKLASYAVKLIDLIIPPYAPLINLEEKLIPKEEKKDYALIRHYSEFQILLGLFLLVIGVIVAVFESLLWIAPIFGIILIATGFEIEEIYITNIRLLIRKIGFVERLIKVPADEEHILKHVVSFNVGRAPMNKILTGMSIIGPLIIAFREISNPGSISTFLIISIMIISVFIFILGMRLGKRILVIHLAGGHQVLLGTRKGIPLHILNSMIQSVYSFET